MTAMQSDALIPKKNLLRILLITAGILLIPLVAMQFTNEVDWGLSDFVIIGTLLVGTGLAYELIARKLSNPIHRLVLGSALLAILLLIWAELAVGIFGTPFAGS